MFKVIDKDKDHVIVKMDTMHYEYIKDEIEEDFNDYEFVFEKSVRAKDLLIK